MFKTHWLDKGRFVAELTIHPIVHVTYELDAETGDGVVFYTIYPPDWEKHGGVKYVVANRCSAELLAQWADVDGHAVPDRDISDRIHENMLRALERHLSAAWEDAKAFFAATRDEKP